MKTVIALITAIALTILLNSCAEKAPSIRVTNQRANKANVQIQQSNGNTINHNDVQPGTSSNYQDIVPGIINVKAVIQNEENIAENRFVATNDHNYTIVILATEPVSIRIDVLSK